MGSYQSSLGPIPLAKDANLTLFNTATPAVALTLVIQDKMWSWNDSGTVCLADGRPIMKVKGQWDALWGARRHNLNALDGQTILSIKREIFSFNRTYTVYYGADVNRPALTIKRLDAQFGSKWKVGVFLTGQHTPLIVIKGSHFDGYYYGFLGEPKAGAKKILEVDRRYSPFNPPKYFLDIAPNMDTALMVVIGMYIEEVEESLRKK